MHKRRAQPLHRSLTMTKAHLGHYCPLPHVRKKRKNLSDIAGLVYETSSDTSASRSDLGEDILATESTSLAHSAESAPWNRAMHHTPFSLLHQLDQGGGTTSPQDPRRGLCTLALHYDVSAPRTCPGCSAHYVDVKCTVCYYETPTRELQYSPSLSPNQGHNLIVEYIVYPHPTSAHSSSTARLHPVLRQLLPGIPKNEPPRPGCI